MAQSEREKQPLIDRAAYRAIGEAQASVDGGDLDCGSGLLLIIRRNLHDVTPGGLFEIRSRELSVEEDLPAWCRLVGHTLEGKTAGDGRYVHYLLRKRSDDVDLDADLDKARDYRWRTRVKWTGGMGGTAFVRNHSFPVGQPASFDTADPAPGALEYLMAALGSCLTVGLQWRCSKRGIEVRNCEVSLSGGADNILFFLGIETDGHPGLADVSGTLYIDADCDDEVLDEVWQETVAGSPVAQSLLRGTTFNVSMKKV